MAKGDSATTSHYWRTQDVFSLKNIEEYKGPSILLPDTGEIPPVNQGTLSSSGKMSKKAQTPTTLSALRSPSLIL